MGPEATAHFFSLIIQRTRAGRDQDHIPVIVDCHPEIPDRTAAIMGKGPSPARPLLAGARRLARAGRTGLHEAWAVPPVFLAAIYGGYFGAGLSVIVLAVLGLVLEDTLTRLNGLKQAIAFSVNVTAAIFFVFSGQVVWLAAIVMAVGALIGGALGGRLAGRVKPSSLRRIVVTIGVIVGIIYLVRG